MGSFYDELSANCEGPNFKMYFMIGIVLWTNRHSNTLGLIWVLLKIFGTDSKILT